MRRPRLDGAVLRAYRGLVLLEFLAAALLAPSAVSAAPVLQVAVVVDDSVLVDGQVAPSLIQDLAIIERRLRDVGGTVQVAELGCEATREGPRPVLRRRFTSPEGLGLTSHLLTRTLDPLDRPCRLDADVIAYGLRALPWHQEARRHILVVSKERAQVPHGKQTFEEVMRDAEHAGVMVHGLALDIDEGEAALTHLTADLRAFMRDPIAPLGRPPAHLRQGVLLTGGTFRVSVAPASAPAPPAQQLLLSRALALRLLAQPDLSRIDTPTLRGAEAALGFSASRIRDELQRRLRIRASEAREARRARWRLPETYGLRIDSPYEPGVAAANPRDMLDALASGAFSPAQIDAEALPTFLRGYPLEPLLDAVWDFVDARATCEQIIRAVNPAGAPSSAGLDIAAALLTAPSLPPSRR